MTMANAQGNLDLHRKAADMNAAFDEIMRHEDWSDLERLDVLFAEV